MMGQAEEGVESATMRLSLRIAAFEKCMAADISESEIPKARFRDPAETFTKDG